VPKSRTDLPGTSVSTREVLAEFEKLLQSRHHLGARNFLRDLLLEPRNPFQQVQRKPQRWLVAGAGILGLAAFLVYWFHSQ
jgi:hypothetical protein